MMQRIMVRPAELRALAATFDQLSDQLALVADRLAATVGRLDWEGSERLPVEERVAAARGLAARLAAGAKDMSTFLRTRAEQFHEADAAGLTDMQQILAGLKELLGRMLAWTARLSLHPEELAAWAVVAAGGTALSAVTGTDWMRQQFSDLFGGESPTETLPPPPVDAFWAAVGQPPVVDGQFSPAFQPWAESFNAHISAHWGARSTDYAGTSGGENLVERYRLTPAKVEQLWSFAAENHVDPRLLLAILKQEGTGSFNTNPANSQHFGGHGPQPDFAADLAAALNGPILSKLRLYPYAVEGGFEGNWVQWVNWYTPIDSPGFQGAPGVYAADINWGAGVERHYRAIAATLGDGSGDPVQAYSQWMGEHKELFQPKHIAGEFMVSQGLPPGVDRPMLAVWGGHPKPDFPGTTGPKGGFWWFPAPDEYCWHVVRK